MIKTRGDLINLMAKAHWERTLRNTLHDGWNGDGHHWDELTPAIRDTHRRYMEVTLCAVENAGASVQPNEPTDEMLEHTVDDDGRPRLLEFTAPAERAGPFVICKFTWRAMGNAGPFIRRTP